jgi:hypothetical protein
MSHAHQIKRREARTRAPKRRARATRAVLIALMPAKAQARSHAPPLPRRAADSRS